jgi:hypothetical protein
MPDINSPEITNAILEGARTMCEVLRGGYIVHPDPPPNSVITERIRSIYERNKISIEKLFILGYTTSGEPWKIGAK